jgi:multidrug efflux system outer membrane protein
MNKLATLLLTLSITACAVGPDYVRPDTELPAEWTGSATGEVSALPRWWETFGDPQLTARIEQSIERNNDLKIAAANVAEAAAALRLTGTDYYPDINGRIDATRSSGSENAVFPLATQAVSEYSAGLVVNYEIDIWGRVRRANEAALADLTGDAAVRDGVQSAVAANVAHAYFEALALRRQINLLERLQETRTDNLRLQKLRLDGGLISPYDYEQSRSETAAVAARLPELRAALQNAVTALSVLSGRSPAEIFRDWQSTRSTSFFLCGPTTAGVHPETATSPK